MVALAEPSAGLMVRTAATLVLSTRTKDEFDTVVLDAALTAASTPVRRRIRLSTTSQFLGRSPRRGLSPQGVRLSFRVAVGWIALSRNGVSPRWS
jgi:hypothetical protein